jgi:UbiD family decarboxylase
MSFQSFRGFIEKLEAEGQLVTVNKEIYPEPDIRAYLRAAADMGKDGPAVMFDNLKGYKGYRVAGNVHGSWTNHAIMLGMDRNASIREQFFYVDKLWSDLDKGSLKWVENAPSQEVVVDKDINLYELMPLFRINENDAGCYFSKACVISRDPDAPEDLDLENVGMYRVMVQGPDTLAMQALGFHDLSLHLKKAEERNEPLQVAICIGNPPLLAAMAATPLAEDQSEYKVASALMGQPFEVTKGKTVNLTIPAGSEYVIEGEIIPRKRVCEGPFGEFPGSYSGARQQVQIKIKCVTHRTNPIFENLYIGRPWTEHDTLIGLWTSVPMYKQVKATQPEVTCVNALYQHGLTVVIATDQRFGGYAKTVAFRLACTPHGTSYAKNIIVVDGDVDPFNLEQVMWALSARVRADKDVQVITNTPGMPLDPCSEPAGMGNKLIIDATTPKAPDKMREITMIANPPKRDEALAYLKKLKK